MFNLKEVWKNRIKILGVRAWVTVAIIKMFKTNNKEMETMESTSTKKNRIINT